MRHGYYIAADGTEHGDTEFSAEARRIWTREVGEPKSVGRYDGVSIWTAPDGSVVRRLLVQNFASEKVDVVMKNVDGEL